MGNMDNMFGDKDELVEQEFKKLKKDGLIKKKRKIKAKSPILKKYLMKSSIFNKILYYHDFTNKVDIDKDDYLAIRWALLHEEAHLTKYNLQNKIKIIVPILAIPIILTVNHFLGIYDFITENSRNIIISCLYMGSIIGLLVGVLFLLVYKIFSNKLKKDEKNCDIWACEKLKSQYGCKYVHKEADKILPDGDEGLIHPCKKERIENIKNQCDNKK